jgi:hypothetical protein
MRNHTVRLSIFLFFITLLLLSASGLILIRSAAQSGNPEGYLPIVLREQSFGDNAELNAPVDEIAAAENEYFINGYRVPASLYDWYYDVGADVVGEPITEFNKNEGSGNFEMVFKNMAVYIDAEDPEQKVNIMPLGLQRLLTVMNATPSPGANIAFSLAHSNLFELETKRLGELFTGRILHKLAIDDAGHPLRIFENVAMKVDPANPTQVQWLPIPAILGIKPTDPVPALNDPRFSFYVLEGKLGHNVPQEFWEYIVEHADLGVTGKPTTEIFYADDAGTVVRQCFENLCLDYDTKTNIIKPAALGREYYRLYNQSDSQEDLSNITLSVNLWEAQSTIQPGQPQIIYARIAQNKLPIINLQPVLEITLPDQSRQTYLMPASDVDGVSAIQTQPIFAPNGSIIPYQVCLVYSDATRTCAAEQFMIWNTP